MAVSNTTPDPSQLHLLIDAGFELIPLHGWDEVSSRGRKMGKAPMYNGWGRTKPLTVDKAVDHMERGGNIGIRLGKAIGDQFLCAYDIDKGNLPNGLDDFPVVVGAIAESLGVALADLVVHESGNNGLHIFFLSSEPDLRGYIEIDGIKVEVKSKGQQVVAPGSIHPDTQLEYRIHPDSTDHDRIPVAPDDTVAALRKPWVSHIGPQIIPPSRLMWIAKQLRGTDALLQYDDWLQAGMAFHAASGGDDYGLEAWIYCSDPGEDDHCQYKWATFGDGEITERSLNHFLEQADADPTDAPKLTAEEVAEFIAPDFADLGDHEVASPKPKNRLLSLGELFKLPPPVWLVDHAIPENSLTVLYGPPKSAKTFLAIDIALSIATGRGEIHGFDCQPGRVLYVLAEGGAAMMGNRAKAWINHHSRECTSDFAILDQAVTLSSQKSVDRLLEDMEEETWDLVVVDTLARCMDGDENSAKDMNLAIKGCDHIRRKTGVAVLLVHHSGKDQSKGMRGSTALLGAVDATIKMRTQGTMGGYELSVPELRHGEPPEPKWLRLQTTGDSAVLVGGEGPDNGRKGSGADVLEFIGRVIEDGTSRKEVADEVATQFGFTDRTARRRIESYVPLGPNNAVDVAGIEIWREADTTSTSPKAEVIRVRDLA